jgi:pilus assembly protein CpaC
MALVNDEFDIRINLRKSVVIDTDGRIDTVWVVDPLVVDAHPISSQQVLLLAKSTGTTDIVIKLESGATVWRHITVGIDEIELEERLESLFGGDLKITEASGTIAVSGLVEDAARAEALSSYMNATKLNWVNLTTMPGLRQVQLRVRIAEASREGLRELAMDAVIGGESMFGGVQLGGSAGVGITPAQGTAAAVGVPGAAPSGITSQNFEFQQGRNLVTDAVTLFGGIPTANLEVYLKALSRDRYIRMLAEPNLVALSGEEASFLVGGEFPIPIVQGSSAGGGSTVTVEYKKFGVQLTFRPEVLGNGRIRLEVAPEVSDLSEEGAVNIGGISVPGITTRRSQTTVELGSGETFAMAGLLSSRSEGTIERVPLLGDLPILGPLFRSVRYRDKETELLVLVTAEFSAPMKNGGDRPLPGELHTRPNDWELFMEGSLDGKSYSLSPAGRLKHFGLGDLRGPGAWKRPDDDLDVAGDPMPSRTKSSGVSG